MVALQVGAAVLGCSRTASTDSSKQSVSFPKTTTTAWQVKCDRMCEVKARAASLDALCVATAESAKNVIGKASCASRKAVGFPQIPASAVTDAAIVELASAGKIERHAFLAVKTAKGWEIARSLGSGISIKTVSASPVDVPGLAPAGIQLHVALGGESGSSERMFVCGLSGEGNSQCPVAIEVAGSKASNTLQMAANASGSMNEWRVAVELTPKGYVAKAVKGDVPEGLAGEHTFQ
jgi:hypothetical protein